jgi:hypothetical protein
MMNRVFFKKRRAVVFYLPALFLIIALASGTQACKKKVGEPPSKKGAVSKTKIPSEKSLAGRKEGLVMASNPRDGWNIFDLKQPVIISFSRKVDPTDFSFRIKPSPEGWTTRWLEEGKRAILDHANPFQAGMRYELELKLKAPSEKQTVRFRAFGPSSLDLIEADDKKGLLDLDTGWTYKLQALFEPEVLPEKYQSLTPLHCGTSPMTEFMNVREKLKPETMAKLKPYLVRPTDSESIYAKRVSSMKKSLASGNSAGSGLLFAGESQRPDSTGLFCGFPYGSYKIWVPYSCDFAKIIAQDIDGYKIWESFEGLMGETPPSDAGERDNGGDGLLDIYFVPPSSWIQSREDPQSYVMGRCIPTQTGKTSPSYIVIDATLESDATGKFYQPELEPTIAHEIFHSFQFAFNKDADRWWKEGTATWAENFINSTWDSEHLYDAKAFDPGEHRLKTLTSEGGTHEYAMYLFPFYLAKVHGDKIVADIWQYCTQASVLDAVDTALGAGGKGFEDAFKKFAYMNWSQWKDDEVEKYPEEVKPEDLHENEVTIRLAKEILFDKNIDLPPLAAVYYLFKSENVDKNALPHVVFDLKEFKKNDKLSVQAFVEYRNKDPKYEDWTGFEKKEFCLNDDDEDFMNVFLTLANAGRSQNETPELKVTLDQESCAGAYLDITRKEHYFSHSWGSSYDSTSTRDEEVTLRVNFDATQISMDAGKPGKEAGVPYGYTVIQGQEPKVVSYNFHRVAESVVDGEKKRHEASGSAPKPDMPDVPTLAGTKPDGTKFSLKPYPAIIFLYDAMSGKVKYVLVPDFTLKFEWDDGEGKESLFDAKPLAQGDSHERIDVAGMQLGRMRVQKINEVTTGDGIKSFGNQGQYKHENRGKSSYELQEKSYKWQVTIRKQKSK